ncbi:MAG: TMEM165/GDT1 family protein [Thaumarchaeota archaeon]|nr:TMEM165/GDT1 family protein [Nitrososphaerota archaeon]
MDPSLLVSALLTTMGTLFVAELTDKDALFLLSLATKTKAVVVFAAGSVAFTITTGIIVLVGSALLTVVPVLWIKVVGGTIMIAYALWEYTRPPVGGPELEKREGKVLGRLGGGQWSVFFPAVVALVTLDLAGDATELLTIVLLARFDDILVVFAGAVIGLVAATAVETALGNRLGRLLSPKRIKYISVAVLLIIGSAIVVTSLLNF